MSERKWTHGPWKAAPYSSVVGCPIVAQPDPTQNSIIVAGTRSAQAMESVAFKTEVVANAHLIAAAPELFEALEEALNLIIGPHEYDGQIVADWSNRAIAALAKAKQEPTP